MVSYFLLVRGTRYQVPGIQKIQEQHLTAVVYQVPGIGIQKAPAINTTKRELTQAWVLLGTVSPVNFLICYLS